MARVTEALSTTTTDYADPRPLPGPAEHVGGQDKPGIDSRAVRGIALAVALSLPLWGAIVLGAVWMFR